VGIAGNETVGIAAQGVSEAGTADVGRCEGGGREGTTETTTGGDLREEVAATAGGGMIMTEETTETTDVAGETENLTETEIHEGLTAIGNMTSMTEDQPDLRSAAAVVIMMNMVAVEFDGNF